MVQFPRAVAPGRLFMGDGYSSASMSLEAERRCMHDTPNTWHCGSFTKVILLNFIVVVLHSTERREQLIEVDTFQEQAIHRC